MRCLRYWLADEQLRRSTMPMMARAARSAERGGGCDSREGWRAGAIRREHARDAEVAMADAEAAQEPLFLKAFASRGRTAQLRYYALSAPLPLPAFHAPATRSAMLAAKVPRAQACENVAAMMASAYWQGRSLRPATPSLPRICVYCHHNTTSPILEYGVTMSRHHVRACSCMSAALLRRPPATRDARIPIRRKRTISPPFSRDEQQDVEFTPH